MSSVSAMKQGPKATLSRLNQCVMKQCQVNSDDGTLTALKWC